MTFKFDGYNWLVRLERGEKLVEELTKLVIQEKLPSAWISGLGAAMWAELSFYDLERQEYQTKKLDGPLEIASLQGNLAWSASRRSDEPAFHIHGTFSDREMRAFGGHVKELEVAGTCEILLHRWYIDSLQRKTDPDTGLNLLDL